MFAQTTHVVAAPRGFVCVGIPARWLYIPSFIEIRSEVSEPQGGQNLPFPITLAIGLYNSLNYRTSRDYYYYYYYYYYHYHYHYHYHYYYYRIFRLLLF